MSFRKAANGDIYVPNRGSPPPAPEGYIRDPGNPFAFHPILQICEKRTFKQLTSSCCGQYRQMFCSDKKIEQVNCVHCKEHPWTP